MRSKHREALQEIICEAESRKIMKQQNGEVEIIYIAEDQQSQGDEELILVEMQDDEDEDDASLAPIFLGDDLLMKRISELLQIVIEESLLKELGFGTKPVDDVLCSVLEQCSRTPNKRGDSPDDDSTRMRDNTKLLFSLVLDEDHIKSLLNNYTVDEVITIVLRMAK